MWIWIGGIVVSILSFLLGKVFSQSEKILEHKKAVYERFLMNCPTPNDTYGMDEGSALETYGDFNRLVGLLSIYASEEVLLAARDYLQKWAEASEILTVDSPALVEEFKTVAAGYNRMVLEMRRDVLRSRLSTKQSGHPAKPLTVHA